MGLLLARAAVETAFGPALCRRVGRLFVRGSREGGRASSKLCDSLAKTITNRAPEMQEDYHCRPAKRAAAPTMSRASAAVGAREARKSRGSIALSRARRGAGGRGPDGLATHFDSAARERQC